ncbi:hypothetical protein SLEP1_g29210 [Rubroshorea leprosula]|uniref:Uncharacterized protein n=1 Tax=Rubroshorea leprosula TaxID=152421 RepID=A0AAV5K5K4_9ROSI|nr:hypothetical protein SLEP1_g29210 [Rubroshorea leprosula]
MWKVLRVYAFFLGFLHVVSLFLAAFTASWWGRKVIEIWDIDCNLCGVYGFFEYDITSAWLLGNC